MFSFSIVAIYEDLPRFKGCFPKLSGFKKQNFLDITSAYIEVYLWKNNYLSQLLHDCIFKI